MFTEEEYQLHLQSHRQSLFKCGVCRRAFSSWKEAGRHLRSHKLREGFEGKRRILLPEDPERLLTATCKFKKCKRQFIGLKGQSNPPQCCVLISP